MVTQPVHPHQTRRLATAIAAVGTAAVLFAGTGAYGAPAEAQPTQFSTPCTIDTAYLPQTADAATHWLATCYEVDQLPRTADAIDHWL